MLSRDQQLTKAQKLAVAGTAIAIAEPALALAHTGVIGVIVGLAAGAIAYNAVSDIEKPTSSGEAGETPPLPPAKLPSTSANGKPSLAYRLFNGKSTRNQGDETAAPASTTGTDQAQQAPSIARLQCNEIIKNTPLNSFLLCIGRSLTKRDNPPVWINFYGRHLKIIGASQFGKSSMAAAILYLITRTHTPDKVLIALLDMENKTGKLLEDVPHLASVAIGDQVTTLHARSREQVLEYLNYIVAVQDERYQMSEAELEEEPILLVYLEEFLALKDHFKRRIDRTSGEAREQARRDYAELIFNISEIARLGQKVKVQLILCAQVDYRDDDLQEALINITSGLSFCVRVSAAQAAGFLSNDLLRRNVEQGQKGQAVIETPEYKDLILANDYDLKKKLLAYEQAHRQTAPAIREQRASILAPRGSRSSGQEELERDFSDVPALPNTPAQGASATSQQPEAPALENPNQRRLTSYHRRALEHWHPGISYRELGKLINVGKDKAGELLEDLREWGFISEEDAEEA